MKKIVIPFAIGVISLFSITSKAQSEYTAFTLSNYYNEGTARGAAMGNALTALGGDMGAISLNPAASAVYKYNEVSITPTFSTTGTTSNFFDNITTSHRTTFGISNAGGVASFNTGRKDYGLVSYSFAITYDKLNNFNTSAKTYGNNNKNSYIDNLTNIAVDNLNYLNEGIKSMDINDSQDPYSYFGANMWPSIMAWNTSLIDSTGTTLFPVTSGNSRELYKMKSYGSNGQINANFGFNFSNLVYVGINLTMHTIWNTVEEDYDEENLNSGEDWLGLHQYYHQNTSGTGISSKLGIIVTPTKNLRFGATISTPTKYNLTDKYYWDMSADYLGDSAADHPLLLSPEGAYDYVVIAPFRYSVGVAATFGMGAVSVDYEGVNYSQTRLKEVSGNRSHDSFTSTNSNFKKSYTTQHNVRAGIEINPTSCLSVRAGYQYHDSGIKDINIDTHVGSFGLGYTDPSGFFADIAMSSYLKKTDILYDATSTIADYVYENTTSVKRTRWNLLLTFGYRF